MASDRSGQRGRRRGIFQRPVNEADSGKPVIVDIWRCSQGVTKSLSLINKGFGVLDVEGTLLQDPTKTGTGISKYYRTRVK